MKYEVKGLFLFVEVKVEDLFLWFVGVDEEMKTVPDMEKKLDQMDENGEEFDFDDDDDDIPDIGLNWKQYYLSKFILFYFHIDENDEENGKTTADDLSDFGKLLKSDAVSKGR